MKKEFQEWLDDAELAACPFCGATSNPLDDLGRVRYEAVRISHTVKRTAWADILPEERQYLEMFTVRCGCCGAEISMTDREAVKKAWNRRAEPGKPTYYDEHMEEQRKALERLPEIMRGL